MPWYTWMIAPDHRVDAVILSALPVEHGAVVAALREIDSYSQPVGDAYLAVVGGSRVVAVLLAATGNAGSAAGAQRAIDTWAPANLVLTGIAAGVADGRIHRGDVLVAETVVGYEPGRHDDQGLRRRPDVHRATFALVAAARAVDAEDWNPGHPDPSQVHFGTVLAGEKVLADEEVFAQLRRDWPTTVGVEMEGLGVATAAHRNDVGLLVVKGVSDFADAGKDDSWRERAAYAAARFAVAVLARRDSGSDPRTPMRAQTQRFALARPGYADGFVAAVAGAIYGSRGADIWVNSENTNMEMSRTTDFTISGIIRYWGARRDQAGRVVDDLVADELRRRVRRRAPVVPGTVVTTGSGALAASHGVQRIIHVASVIGEPGAGFRQVRNIAACMNNVLAESDRLARADRALRVVLVPLLGVGAGGGALAPTVAAMVDATVDFLDAAPQSPLSEVRLLGYNAGEWGTLTAALAAHPRLVRSSDG